MVVLKILEGIDPKSMAGIGVSFDIKGEDDLYGKWLCIFAGRYMLQYSQKRGIEFCNYFAFGCG